MTTSIERYGSLVSRVALAAIFVVSGFGKLAGVEGATALIASKGMPAPMLLAVAAGVIEVLGGLLLILGLRTRIAAAALALFLVPATVIFHNPFGLSGVEAHLQQIHALKNIAIAGGLGMLVTWGAGAISLDWLRSHGEPRALARTPAS